MCWQKFVSFWNLFWQLIFSPPPSLFFLLFHSASTFLEGAKKGGGGGGERRENLQGQVSQKYDLSALKRRGTYYTATCKVEKCFYISCSFIDTAFCGVCVPPPTSHTSPSSPFRRKTYAIVCYIRDIPEEKHFSLLFLDFCGRFVTFFFHYFFFFLGSFIFPLEWCIFILENFVIEGAHFINHWCKAFVVCVVPISPTADKKNTYVYTGHRLAYSLSCCVLSAKNIFVNRSPL